MESGKPRKQRAFRYNAPMHIRQHFVHVHVDKSLKSKLGLKRRTVQVSKGDTVKVVAGANKGKTGKVTAVRMRRGFVYIDSLKRKDAKGKEHDIPIHASNVYVTDLALSDKYRAEKLKLRVSEQKPKAASQAQGPAQGTAQAASPPVEKEPKGSNGA